MPKISKFQKPPHPLWKFLAASVVKHQIFPSECNAMKTNWSDEERRRRSQRIRDTQPWKRSTGPKSAAGKAAVALNAAKHGLRGGIYRQAADLLAKQNKLLKDLNNDH